MSYTMILLAVALTPMLVLFVYLAWCHMMFGFDQFK